jgi:hypothetical protein
VYTLTAADTTAELVAASVMADLQQSPLAELRNFTFSASGSVLTCTGPADGRPVSIAFTAGGGGVTVSVSTTNPTSPFDLGDGANYSGGSLPANGDVLVFDNSASPVLWNLNALASLTVSIVKRAGFTGQIGLSDTNDFGYPEYLPTHLATAGTSITIEDNGAMCRLRSTASSAVTANLTGPGNGQLGAESVEIHGTPASSVINMAGATLAFCPLSSQTGTAATVRCANSVLRVGTGATLGAVNISDSQAVIASGYTTLFADRGSQVRVQGAAAAGTSTTNQGGTVVWASTGTPGAVTLGSDAVFDLSQAPSAMAVGTVTLAEGSNLNNPFDRLTRPYTVAFTGEVGRTTLDIGTGQTVTVN